MDYSKVYGDFLILDKSGSELDLICGTLQDAIDQMYVHKMLDSDVGISYFVRWGDPDYWTDSFDSWLKLSIDSDIDIYFQDVYCNDRTTFLSVRRGEKNEEQRGVHILELRNIYYYEEKDNSENMCAIGYKGIYNLFRQLYKEEYVGEYTTEEYGTCVVKDKGVLFKDTYLYRYDRWEKSFVKWTRLDFISEKIAICYKEDDNKIR